MSKVLLTEKLKPTLSKLSRIARARSRFGGRELGPDTEEGAADPADGRHCEALQGQHQHRVGADQQGHSQHQRVAGGRRHPLEPTRPPQVRVRRVHRQYAASTGPHQVLR